MTLLVFGDVVNDWIAQAIALRIIREAISIKATQAFPRCNPQITFRVLMHRGHMTVGETIRDIVMTNGELLARCAPRDTENGNRHCCDREYPKNIFVKVPAHDRVRRTDGPT